MLTITRDELQQLLDECTAINQKLHDAFEPFIELAALDKAAKAEGKALPAAELTKCYDLAQNIFQILNELQECDVSIQFRLFQVTAWPTSQDKIIAYYQGQIAAAQSSKEGSRAAGVKMLADMIRHGAMEGVDNT